MVPQVDYFGPLALTLGARALETTQTLLRRSIRVILGLGPNIKNLVIETFLDTNRHNAWRRRLNQIAERWESKGIHIGVDRTEIQQSGLREPNKWIDSLPQEETRNIINLYNRGKCRSHNKHLTTQHLADHSIELDYSILLALLKSQQTQKIVEIARLITDLT